MGSQSRQAVSIAYVTGHHFGVQALDGLLTSPEYNQRLLDIRVIFGLPRRMESETVGYRQAYQQAKAHGIQYLEAHDFRLTSYVELIRSYQIDALVVIGWSYLIPEEVRSAVRMKRDGIPVAIGMHPSPLPVGRGRAPIPWTILNELEKTALSVFLLTDEADAGPIIFQIDCHLDRNETSSTLYQKFAHLHRKAGQRLASSLVKGLPHIRAQDEERATIWKRRRPSDGQITQSLTVEQALRLFRAQSSPYPTCFIMKAGTPVEVLGLRTTLPSDASDWSRYVIMDGVIWLKLGRRINGVQPVSKERS